MKFTLQLVDNNGLLIENRLPNEMIKGNSPVYYKIENTPC